MNLKKIVDCCHQASENQWISMHIIFEKYSHSISACTTTVAETGKHPRNTVLLFARVPFCCGVILVWAALPTWSAAAVCPENQTAELGERGYISCYFPDGFRSIYWFDDISESSHVVVTLRKAGGTKSGQGFSLGYYDVQQNGTLIIANVTTWHERMYRVIVYTGVTHNTYVIPLKVIASPRDQFPIIQCHTCHQEYYCSVMKREMLTCSYGAARPQVQLEWFEQRGDGYENVEMQQLSSTENSNGTYNSTATLHSLTDWRNLIHFLRCRATWPLSDWRREREILLDLSSNISFSDITPKVQYMEISKRSKIRCGQSASIYEIWKRILSSSEPEVIGFHSHVMTGTISITIEMEVSAKQSLIFSSPQVHHEGIYVCIYGDGQKEEIQMTSVKLLIPPSPPYIQITGCDDVGYRCVIREDSTKNLTCAVYGVRPNVTLEWITEDRDEIAFFNHKEVFKERGETSDTILSVQYKVSQDILCAEEILIKCHLYGPLSHIMKAEATALVIPATCRENEVKEEYGLDGAVMALVVFCVLIVIVIAICLITYRICRNLTRSTTRVAHNNGVSTGDSQEAFLKRETRETGTQIPNRIPPCIVNETDEDVV